MSAFLDAALGFPAVLFSFALIVVAGYWVLVLIGALGLHVLDLDADTGAGAGHGHGHGGHGEGAGGMLSATGLAGPPVTVTLSLLIALAWFISLAGRVLLDGPGHAWAHALVLVAAVVGAWAVTWLLVRPLRRAFPDVPPPSRADFVGRTCVIRTGRVTGDFGQAEVTAEDGSTALVQVRAPETGPRPGSGTASAPEAGIASASGVGTGGLGRGATALIFDYDAAAEVFLVMPFDETLGAGR
ncbi:DUF1449 family protein [Actinomadura harenae]|uniref:DUF1449 family protein n=1 Tax=Actinomadura harenae TaxID=2483351 RepID=A0A3M2LZ35_9ACTN|nr:DUF1449 family protein [Actinomadura harenae]RMI42412.1 DUF1449 family protein [Actinomadura harenae]